MAMDRWIEITPEGAFLVSENDGWAYMRRGAQRTRAPVSITKITNPRPGSPWGNVDYTGAGFSGGISVTIEECERIRTALGSRPDSPA